MSADYGVANPEVRKRCANLRMAGVTEWSTLSGHLSASVCTLDSFGSIFSNQLQRRHNCKSDLKACIGTAAGSVLKGSDERARQRASARFEPAR